MIRMMLTFKDSEYKSLNRYAKGKGVSVEETIKEVLQLKHHLHLSSLSVA